MDDISLNNSDNIYKCDYCEKVFYSENNDLLIPDPYIKEVNNEIVMVTLCPDCYQERCDDI